MTTDLAQHQGVATQTPQQVGPRDAFENHEERIQRIERLGRVLGEAFPHLMDSLGLDRMPHQFTPDESSGIDFTPGAGTVAELVRQQAATQQTIAELREQNAKLQEIMEQVFNRLPAPPGASGSVVNPGEIQPPPQ